MPQHLEAGWEVFKLLADLSPDTLALATTRRAGLGVEVVLDLDPLQVLGQLLPTVLVAVLDPTRDELLARLLFDARLRERKLVNTLSEQRKRVTIHTLTAVLTSGFRQFANPGDRSWQSGELVI